ncbi:MAG: response regulator transcription factor, partial [Polyangiaceae bacterium]|nr:response regulator transcription factor [Polyangiaceae bacterium]
MKVVLAGSSIAELEPFAESLREDGHAVRVAADHVAVAACIEERPGLVLLDVPRQAESVHAVIHKLREITGAPPFLLFLLVGGEVDDDLLLRAYETGIDGELRRPFSFAYFSARVASAARLARRPDPGVVTSVSKTSAASAVRSMAATPGPRTIAVAGLADRAATESENALTAATLSGTWRNAGESIRKTASGFLGLPVTLVADGTAPPANLGCAISLTHPLQQLEIRLAVGADVKSARRLAVHMFGEDGDGLMGDMLNEVANLFMGTLKTSFSAEEIYFTAGLPETIS